MVVKETEMLKDKEETKKTGRCIAKRRF